MLKLHFNDPRAYNRIFSVNSQLSKDPSFYACFGVDTSTFGLMDSEQARLSRELMSIYFNRRSILQFESVIQTKVRFPESCMTRRSGRSYSDVNIGFGNVAG